MKYFLNYLGQLRLYSLLDFLLLLYVIQTPHNVMAGAILLWIGFLLFLESQHKHSYRSKFPPYLWVLFGLAGLVLFHKIEGLVFVLASYLYTKKKDRYFSYLSPLFRGLQNYFLIVAIIGYHNYFVWVVFVLTIVRNILGDFRDVEKDRAEKMQTVPVLIGLKRNIKYIHLGAVMVTSLVWWLYGGLAWEILVGVWAIELVTYNLTPR